MRTRSLKRILFGWVLLIILVALVGDVSIAASNAGRTAADFLQIGPSARAAGFGNAFTAVSEGAMAAYWNPAGLAQLEYTEALLSHFSWYQDISLEYGSFAFRVTDDATAAVSVTYLNYGQIDGYDAAGVATGDLTAYDWAGGLSFGYAANDELSFGITGKYIRQQLDTYSASAFAADLGVKYSLRKFQFAAAVSNVGSTMKFAAESEKLPASARFGIAYAPMGDQMLTSVEVQKEFYGDFRIRQGVEVGFYERYYLRTGYEYLTGQDGRSFVSGLTFGGGFRYEFAGLDYAYTPQDDATSEDIHRFTLVFLLNR